MNTRPLRLTSLAVAAVSMAAVPARAWWDGGRGRGGGWAAASGGHWAAGGYGHANSGTYGNYGNGVHYATGSKGGSVAAGQWPVGRVQEWANQFRQLRHDGVRHALRDRIVWRGGRDQQRALGRREQRRVRLRHPLCRRHERQRVPPSGRGEPVLRDRLLQLRRLVHRGRRGGPAWPSAPRWGATVAAASHPAPVVVVPPPPPVVVAGYVMGDTYVALPRGCSYTPVAGSAYYFCNGAWFRPAFGANGTYYRVVPAP